MNVNERDRGPFRIDLLLSIWSAVSRTADALHIVGAIPLNGADLKALVRARVVTSREEIDNVSLTKTLRVLALQDNMHAADWLGMKAAAARTPRRKQPAAADLHIRLKGLQCRRLVARVDPETKSYCVTIHSWRGDVVSAQGPNFPNVLEGAIKMAGARAEEEP